MTEIRLTWLGYNQLTKGTGRNPALNSSTVLGSEPALDTPNLREDRTAHENGGGTYDGLDDPKPALPMMTQWPCIFLSNICYWTVTSLKLITSSMNIVLN